MSGRLSETPVLETERLILRAFGPDDMDAGVRYLMDPRTVFMGGPFERHDAWEHCAALIGHWAIHGFGLFSVRLKDSDRLIGDAGLLLPFGYPENELGWGIWDTAFEGKGFAYEAAEAVRAHAYRDLGWSTLVSYVDPENTRSIALARRLGCTLDEEAPVPDLPDCECTLVFRHPSPEDV
jgi:RimJ/RimL family protein N-acetyltransferase